MFERVLAEDIGGHKYDPNSGDCEWGCGCWFVPHFGSGGHEGVDPIGTCPNNPLTKLKNQNKKESNVKK